MFLQKFISGKDMYSTWKNYINKQGRDERKRNMITLLWKNGEKEEQKTTLHMQKAKQM